MEGMARHIMDKCVIARPHQLLSTSLRKRRKFPRRFNLLLPILLTLNISFSAGENIVVKEFSQPLAAPPENLYIPADFEARPKTILLQFGIAPDYYLNTIGELLSVLPTDVEVVAVVYEGRIEKDRDWLANLNISFSQKKRVKFIPFKPTQKWSRDNYILGIDSKGRFVTILSDVNMYTLHYNTYDREIYKALNVLGDKNRIVCKADFFFAGGDILQADRHVVVGGDTLTKAIAVKRGSATTTRSSFSGKYQSAPDEFFKESHLLFVSIIEEMKTLFGKDVVAIPAVAAGSHIDTYVTFVGNNRVVVGDIDLAFEHITPEEINSLYGSQERLDKEMTNYSLNQESLANNLNSIADKLDVLEYEVTHIPWLPRIVKKVEDRSYAPFVNYNNVLLLGQEEMIMPIYGVESLDSIAKAVYEQLGYTVRTVNTREISKLGGSLRCLTNIVSVDLRDKHALPLSLWVAMGAGLVLITGGAYWAAKRRVKSRASTEDYNVSEKEKGENR